MNTVKNFVRENKIAMAVNYSFTREIDGEFLPLYSNALTDDEAIRFSADYVGGLCGVAVHVRRDGHYLAEVKSSWNGQQVEIELWSIGQTPATIEEYVLDSYDR